ncbi:MAG: hypothetical protein AUH72_20185 [Acidobacteria bacterium 13_1_40CM_4_65_8]|nr:MAG: hypothetical protein AUH72_20185 [Acidobacteria bacterium 13_1_40CM_4_65_8]
MLVALVSTAFLAACGPQPTSATPAAARNLLFITIDTLRADHVGAYGAKRVATPNIDRVAREGALARHADVQVPLTRPSHISIFSGRYPAEHGIRDNVAPALRTDVPLMAETLKASGFATAGFVSSIVLARPSGLERGFDTFSDRFDVAEDDARFLNTIQRRGDVATGEAVEWIRAHAQDRFFTWVHLYDPHDPYEPPGRYAVEYADRPYDGEVAWSDELVGRLLTALSDAGVADRTLVVVTSDHDVKECSRFLRQRFGASSLLRRFIGASRLLVRIREELVCLGRRGLDRRRRAQQVDGRRRRTLQRENPAEQQVCTEMSRLEIERGAKLLRRVGDTIDARVDGSERVARVGPLRHARRDDFEMAGRGFEVAGLVQRDAELVVREHLLRLQRDRLFQRRDRLPVLTLARACDAEIQLRDRDVRVGRDDLFEERNRFVERAVFDGDDRVV